MYNKIRNQIQYLLTFRSIMFLIFIFLLPILACTISSSGNDAIESGGNGSEDSGWFSNEPNNNDLKQVWGNTWFIDDNEPGKQNVYVLQVWENTRKDYWSDSVSLSTILYASDGSVIDSNNETIQMSAGGTYLVEAEFSGIGSKIKRIETIVNDVYWQNSDSDRIREVRVDLSPSLEVVGGSLGEEITNLSPNTTLMAPVFLVENKSDFEIDDVQLMILSCTKGEDFCYPNSLYSDTYSDSLPSGQSMTFSESGDFQFMLILFSPEARLCAENNANWDSDSLPDCVHKLINKAESVSHRYWLTYTTHFGELVSIEGEIK